MRNFSEKPERNLKFSQFYHKTVTRFTYYSCKIVCVASIAAWFSVITFLPQRYYDKSPKNPYIMHKYPPTGGHLCLQTPYPSAPSPVGRGFSFAGASPLHPLHDAVQHAHPLRRAFVFMDDLNPEPPVGRGSPFCRKRKNNHSALGDNDDFLKRCLLFFISDI